MTSAPLQGYPQAGTGCPGCDKAVPIRTLIAVAPSGGEIRFLKWGDSAERQLSWYQGCLTADENDTFWRAKLKAERPGIDMWEKARALLIAANWTIEQE